MTAASTQQSRLTALLSKKPEAGKVKTRLSPPLSPAGAAALAAAMLEDVVARCAGAPSGFRSVLFYSPEDAGPWFRDHCSQLTDQRPQRGPGLAERLAAVFEEALGEAGVRTVVAIGSDQPLVSTTRILEAHALLEEGKDLVIGPDRGGGYYLIGLRAATPELFTDVPMSSQGTCGATVRLAQTRGLRVGLLPTSQDVDVEEDLVALRAELDSLHGEGRDSDPEFPAATFARLNELYPSA